MKQPRLSFYFQELLALRKSMSFYRALLVLLAVLIPILLGVLFDQIDIGIAIGYGAFWCSPSDVSGSPKHMRNGILFSVVLVTLVTFIARFIPDNIWIVVPSIGIFMILISFISVFGFRASLISFSGLLAFVLSFAFKSDSLSPVIYALLIGSGGLWYLALATIMYRLNPKGQTEEALSEVLSYTAKYIKTRADLIHPDTEREGLQDDLFKYQVKLGELHETLREILLSERRSSGKSSYKRKRVLVFVQLINILEQAMANPINYEKMDELFRVHKEPIIAFQELLEAMCDKLLLLIDQPGAIVKENSNLDLQKKLKEIEVLITAYAHEEESDSEGVLILQNIYKYQVRQAASIEQIFWIMQGGSTQNIEELSDSAAVKFITLQEYSFQILKDNFSVESVIFRHSLRLAVVSMLGFIVGEFLEVHNPFWILLTIIVILHPSYGLTKSRAKERTIGTLIGGVVALGLVFVVHSTTVYAILGAVSFLIAFTMIQQNYRAGAAFITLSIVFVYALIEPNLLNVIQFRVLDTVIGAVLATIGNIFLWPVWEVKNIRGVIAKSLRDNRKFFDEIVDFYEKKGVRPNSYNLARKEAFLSVSNLSATFQRMTQEPKAKQQNLKQIYQLVSLNHIFLSALASTSTFIQNHPTTKASDSFKLAARNINANLASCISLLKEEDEVYEDGAASMLLSDFLSDVDTKTLLSIEQTPIEMATQSMPADVNEAYLIIEQLKWLYSLTEQMHRLIQKI